MYKVILLIIIVLVILHIIKYYYPLCFPDKCTMVKEPHYFMEIYITFAVIIAYYATNYLVPK